MYKYISVTLPVTMEKFGSVRLVGIGYPEDCVLSDACLADDVVNITVSL